MNPSLGANSIHYVRPSPPTSAAPTQVPNPPRPSHYHEPWSLTNGRLHNAAAPGQIVLPPTSQARQAVSPDSGYRSLPSSSSDYQLSSPQTTAAPAADGGGSSSSSTSSTSSGYKPVQGNHISANQKPTAQTPVIHKSKTVDELLCAKSVLHTTEFEVHPPPNGEGVKVTQKTKSLNCKSLPISVSEYQFVTASTGVAFKPPSLPSSKSYQGLGKGVLSDYQAPSALKTPTTPSLLNNLNSNLYRRTIPNSTSDYHIPFINNYRAIINEYQEACSNIAAAARAASSSSCIPHSKSYPNGYQSLPSSSSSQVETTSTTVSANGYKSLPSPTSSTGFKLPTSDASASGPAPANMTRRLSLPSSSSLPLLLRAPRTSSTFHGSPLNSASNNPPPPPAPDEKNPSPSSTNPNGQAKRPTRPSSIYLKGGSFHLPSTAVPPKSPWPGTLPPPPPPTPRNGYQIPDHKVSLFLDIMSSQQRFSKV